MAAKKVAQIEFRGKTTDYEKAVRTIRNENKKASASFEKLAARSRNIFLVAATGIGALVKAFAEEDRATRLLAASLRTIGRETTHTTASLQKMAGQFQRSSTTGNEAIQQMQVQLLTAGNIADENLQPAIQAVLDTAAAMNKPVEKMGRTFALALAKLPADASTAFTALESMGLIMDKVEKDRLKAMAESGKMAEVQSILIAKLQGEYSGLALEQAKSVSGTITRIKNALGDAMENVARAFLQSSGNILERLLTWAEKVEEFTRTHGAMIAGMLKAVATYGAVGYAIGKLGLAFLAIRKGIGLISVAFKAGAISARAFWTAVLGWVGILAQVGAAIWAWKGTDWLIAKFNVVKGYVTDVLPAAFGLFYESVKAKWATFAAFISNAFLGLARELLEIAGHIPFLGDYFDIDKAVAGINGLMDAIGNGAERQRDRVRVAMKGVKDAIADAHAAGVVPDRGPAPDSGIPEVSAPSATGSGGGGGGGDTADPATPASPAFAFSAMDQAMRRAPTPAEIKKKKDDERKAFVEAEKKTWDEIIKMRSSKSKTLRKIGAIGAIRQALIDGQEAVTSIFNGALAFFANPPTTPFAPAIAGAMAATAAINTAARISDLKRAAGMEKGGLIGGPMTDGDSRLRLLAPGELVVPQKNYKEWEAGVRADERSRQAREGSPHAEEAGSMKEVEIGFTADAQDLLRREDNRASSLGF